MPILLIRLDSNEVVMKYRERKAHIADFVLTEEKEFTYSSYECAAWYKTIKVASGKYPVYGDILEDGKIEDTSVRYSLPGIVTSSNFSSHFCGNRVGSKVDTEKGKEASYSSSPYAHAVAWSIIKETNEAIQLLEGFKAIRVQFSYDGKQCETAKLVCCN